MPLPRYGVAIGTFVSFARDPQDQFGHWYHGHLTIATPQGQYASALDVDTPSGIGVSYRISPSLSRSDLGPIAGLPNGWHALTSDSSSGALDYLRSPIFQDTLLHRNVPRIGPFLAGPVKTPSLPGPPPPGQRSRRQRNSLNRRRPQRARPRGLNPAGMPGYLRSSEAESSLRLFFA
jgi:Uncharacterized conserved protein (DUF2278)